jgi:phenylpropionate dioxygenase-like ring-hydroxylating dioxygenase large terminal subunit
LKEFVRMKVPFTWLPTGWFMIGWAAEIPPGTVKALKYFGKDLVAYRTADGELHVLDAHCRHLGAHLGHQGRVNGDCVECPFHGWGWGPDGTNQYIPYEERPNLSKALKSWPVIEQHEWTFLWHDPAGGPPQWPLPSVFDFAGHLPGRPDDYYRAYPELSVKYAREPVHPQIVTENTVDSIHFKYVHGSTVNPRVLEWSADGPFYNTVIGWALPAVDGSERLPMKVNNRCCGIGGSFVVFEGNSQHRLAIFATPVDDECSDMFYSIWWPRGEDGEEEESGVIPEALRERVAKEFLQAPSEDLEIWRHQEYVENPALAQQDARPYGGVRKWARQFYDQEGGA